MPKRSKEKLRKITLNLFDADVERLKDLYPQAGYSVAIKLIVRQHLNQLAAHEAQLVNTLGELDIDV